MSWTRFSDHTTVSLIHVDFARWDTDQSEPAERGAWINLIAGWLYRACLFSSCLLKRKLGRGNPSLIITLRQIDLLTSQDGIRSIVVGQSDSNRKKIVTLQLIQGKTRLRRSQFQGQLMKYLQLGSLQVTSSGNAVLLYAGGTYFEPWQWHWISWLFPKLLLANVSAFHSILSSSRVLHEKRTIVQQVKKFYDFR